MVLRKSHHLRMKVHIAKRHEFNVVKHVILYDVHFSHGGVILKCRKVAFVVLTHSYLQYFSNEK